MTLTFEQILKAAEHFVKIEGDLGSHGAVLAALKDMANADNTEDGERDESYFVRCINVIRNASDKFDQTNNEEDREIYRWAMDGATKDAEQEVLEHIDASKFKTRIVQSVVYSLAMHADELSR